MQSIIFSCWVGLGQGSSSASWAKDLLKELQGRVGRKALRHLKEEEDLLCGMLGDFWGLFCAKGLGWESEVYRREKHQQVEDSQGLGWLGTPSLWLQGPFPGHTRTIKRPDVVLMFYKLFESLLVQWE